MKRIYFILCLLLFSKISYAESINDNFIKLNLNDDFHIKPLKSRIVGKAEYFLELEYELIYKNTKEMNLRISLPINRNVNIQKFINLVDVKEVIKVGDPYGYGEILNIAENDGYIYIDENTKRYATSWGSYRSTDILVYRIKVLNELYSECLVQILNVWPKNHKIPFAFNNQTLEEKIENIPKDYSIYILFDEVFSKQLILK